MQMLFGSVSFGLAVPKTKIEFGVMNMLKFYLRANENAPIHKFQIVDLFNIGGKSGSFVGGAFETDWFKLDPQLSGLSRNGHPVILRQADTLQRGFNDCVENG